LKQVLNIKSIHSLPKVSGDDYTKLLKKINKNSSAELSTRMKYIITSVNGDRETKNIREFVDTAFLARDSKALREHIKEVQPDVDLTFFPEGRNNKVDIPIGLNFFWPDF
jgi:ferritin-like protein